MPGITAEKVLYSRKGKGELAAHSATRTVATGMEDMGGNRPTGPRLP